MTWGDKIKNLIFLLLYIYTTQRLFLSAFFTNFLKICNFFKKIKNYCLFNSSFLLILSDSIKNCEGSKTANALNVKRNASLHSKNCDGSKTPKFLIAIINGSLHSKNCEGSKTPKFLIAIINGSLHSKNCEGSKTVIVELPTVSKSLHSKNCEGSKTAAACTSNYI